MSAVTAPHLQVAVLHHSSRRHGNVSLQDAVDHPSSSTHRALSLKGGDRKWTSPEHLT